MRDIIPPQRRPLQPVPPRQPMAAPRPIAVPPVTPISPPVAPPIAPQPRLEPPQAPRLIDQPKHRSRKKTVLWVVFSLFLVVILAAVGAFLWYKIQLSPLLRGSNEKIRTTITSGTSPSQIGQLLEEKKIIRSHLAFDIYTRLSGTRAGLQAGTYSLSPSESTEQIVAHLVAGKTDEFAITFLPGATLAENRAVLLKAGYSEQEVDAALDKTYTHPLFAGKPASSDLEGYIFGETYHFDGSATPEQIITRTFDEYYKVIQQNNFIESFKKQELTLYQGITLASIIQREVASPADRAQVAQVFFTRLAMGMPLGSDVTYQYAAKKLGVAPSPSLDSPYNTRKYPGLPPGPIATPGLSALQAVATPVAGDYVFFLSGDDNKTYFSRTSEEHDAAIRDHCQVKCLIP